MGQTDASLHIDKQTLHFSAAHFTIFSATEAERLHGHNYQVTVDIWGDMGGEGLIIDVGTLKAIVKRLCDDLDERTLIPAESPHLAITDQPDEHLQIRYSDRRYVLPCADCVLMPVPNITIEALARHLGERLRDVLGRSPQAAAIQRLRLGVEESPGQMGMCELTL